MTWKVKYDPEKQKYVFVNQKGEVHPNQEYNEEKHALTWVKWINRQAEIDEQQEVK